MLICSRKYLFLPFFHSIFKKFKIFSIYLALNTIYAINHYN